MIEIINPKLGTVQTLTRGLNESRVSWRSRQFEALQYWNNKKISVYIKKNKIMKKEEKLAYVLKTIEKLPIKTKNGLKAKKIKSEYYQRTEINFEIIPEETVLNYRAAEVLNLAHELDKMDYFHKYKAEKILGLNIHKFAPELNELVFMDGSIFKTPRITEVSKAITHLIKCMSMEQLKAL